MAIIACLARLSTTLGPVHLDSEAKTVTLPELAMKIAQVRQAKLEVAQVVEAVGFQTALGISLQPFES